MKFSGVVFEDYDLFQQNHLAVKHMKSDLSKPMILSKYWLFVSSNFLWNVFFLIFNLFSQQDILVPLYEHIQLKLGNFAICSLEALGYLSQCLKYLGTEPIVWIVNLGWNQPHMISIQPVFEVFFSPSKMTVDEIWLNYICGAVNGYLSKVCWAILLDLGIGFLRVREAGGVSLLEVYTKPNGYCEELSSYTL